MAGFRFLSSTFLRQLKLARGFRATLSLSNALPFTGQWSDQCLDLITTSRELTGNRYAHIQIFDRKNDDEFRVIHGKIICFLTSFLN